MPEDKMKMALDLYLSCRSYQDLGEIVIAGGRKIQFRTFFEHPRKLFFETDELDSESNHNNYTLWTNGFSLKESQTSAALNQFTGDEIVQEIKLPEAFYRATRQNNLPCYIPTLLLPQLKNLSFGFFDNVFALIRQDDKLFHLESHSRPYQTMKLQLRRSDCAIVHVEISHDTNIKPRINITYDRLMFNENVDHIFDFPHFKQNL